MLVLAVTAACSSDNVASSTALTNLTLRSPNAKKVTESDLSAPGFRKYVRGTRVSNGCTYAPPDSLGFTARIVDSDLA